MRAELSLDDVPFILGGLGDFLTQCTCTSLPDYVLRNYVHVNAALKKISSENPMTGFVSAEGLTANPDNLHFNSKSLYEFGLRYFEEFEKFNKSSTTKKSIESDLIRSEMELL